MECYSEGARFEVTLDVPADESLLHGRAEPPIAAHFKEAQEAYYSIAPDC